MLVCLGLVAGASAEETPMKATASGLAAQADDRGPGVTPELDCGYWGEEAEAALRAAMKKATP